MCCGWCRAHSRGPGMKSGRLGSISEEGISFGKPRLVLKRWLATHAKGRRTTTAE